jgi:hypothetical protein
MVTLTSVSTGASNKLTTDSLYGLQLSVKSCSTPWTQGGTAAAPSYTCSGTTTAVYSGPATGVNSTLTNLASLNSKTSDYLTLSVSLPTTADNSFQSLSASLSITFTGTQRAAAAK